MPGSLGRRVAPGYEASSAAIAKRQRSSVVRVRGVRGIPPAGCAGRPVGGDVGGAGVCDARRGVARRLDHDVDAALADGLHRVRREPRPGNALGAPTDGCGRRLARGSGSRSAITATSIPTADGAWLRKHRAELAGPDQADPHRPAGGRAFAKLGRRGTYTGATPTRPPSPVLRGTTGRRSGSPTAAGVHCFDTGAPSWAGSQSKR